MGASFGSATFPHAYYYSTNYSFGLNGSEVMGYSTMWYTKYAIGPLGLEGETDHLSRAAFDMLVPDLFVVDSGTGQWMRARDTCPLPYWKVDASLREYTVAVCDWAPGDGPSELRLFFHVAPNAVATWGSSGVSMLTAYATWYPATVSVLANATLSHDLDHPCHVRSEHRAAGRAQAHAHGARRALGAGHYPSHDHGRRVPRWRAQPGRPDVR